MAIIQLIQQLIALGEGILGHFAANGVVSVSQAADHEWILTQTTPATLTVKGQYLSGAVADIVVYGAILVDWLVQALLGGGVNAYNGI